MRHTAGVALSSFLIGGCIGIFVWAMVEDHRRYQARRQAIQPPPPVQFMECGHDGCTWVAVGNDAAEAFAHHLATDHVRYFAGEVGE